MNRPTYIIIVHTLEICHHSPISVEMSRVFSVFYFRLWFCSPCHYLFDEKTRKLKADSLDFIGLHLYATLFGWNIYLGLWQTYSEALWFFAKTKPAIIVHMLAQSQSQSLNISNIGLHVGLNTARGVNKSYNIPDFSGAI